MSAQNPSFQGQAGQTRRQGTTVQCGACDARFGATWLASVDGDGSPQLLAALLADGFATVNTMTCPACGWQHVAVEPVVVHLPSVRRMVLVVPGAQRHRVEQARLAHLAAVAADPLDGVPDYVQAVQVVIGLEGLRGALSTGPAALAPKGADSTTAGLADGTPPPDTVIPDPEPADDAESIALIRREAAEARALADAAFHSPRATLTGPPAPAEASVVEALISADLEAVPSEPPPAIAPPLPPSVAPPAKGDLLSAVLGAAPPPPLPEAGAGEGEWADIDQAWSLGEEPAPPAPSDDEPTHVVRADDVIDRHPAGPAFDEAAAGTEGRYLEVEGDAVRAVIRLEPAQARRLETAAVALRFQLHQTPHGPVPALLVVPEDLEDEAEEAQLWLLDPRDAVHTQALRLLEEVFALDLVLHTDAGFHGRRTLRAPLEANVATAIERLAAGRDHDPAAARAVVLAPEFDRVGRLKHNFTEDSFSGAADAAEARLALGILAYWSAPERREYLLRVRSFPESWFDAMTRRVVGAGVHFGLAMDPHLRQRAVELGLAAHAAQLLQRSMANFAEVNLSLRPSGLDPLDIWENWEALLTLAEELDLPVDEDIEEVAAQAMERARHAAQEVEVIDLDDDLSVEVEEVAELGEPDDQELVRQLELPGRRLEAAIALVQRGQAVNVGPIFNAMARMGREELLRLVPHVLAMGPSFEASLAIGLRSKRASLRVACALALGEIRSERAAPAMLGLLQPAGEPEWRILARAIARIGRRILPAAARVVAERGDPAHRVAHALALLGVEARGALSAARAQADHPAVDACLDRALSELGQVGFGDPADFTERLADAFEAIGPDAVTPDYEEDLNSVDLGPGASVSLEADVDLDDLDPAGHS